MISTTLQRDLYIVISNGAHKKGAWNVKDIVNLRADCTMVFVGESVPKNIVHYVKKSYISSHQFSMDFC